MKNIYYQFLIETYRLHSFRILGLNILRIFCIPFFLSSCIPFGLYENAYNAGREYLNPPPFKVTPSIRNLPFAMQLVNYKNSNIVMVLSIVEGSKQTYLDSENKSFTFLHGKVISTYALENNFDVLNPPNLKLIFSNLSKDKNIEQHHESLIRFNNPETSYLNLQYTYSLSKNATKFTRTINNDVVETRIMKEFFKVPNISWEGLNIYWIDETGRVLKSKQILFPGFPKYFIETLKSYDDD